MATPAEAEAKCYYGKCDCNLNVDEIYNKATNFADSFFEEKTPGILVNIEINKRNTENRLPVVRVQVKLYKMIPHGNENQIFDIMAFGIRNCQDLYIFANYLKITIIQWGVQISDTDSD